MPRLFVAAAAALLVLFSGCDSTAGPPQDVTFDATVQTLSVGGPPVYLLAADAPGTFYYPLNLPAEFQEEGARIHVGGVVKDYRVYLEPALEITSIERLP